MKQTDEAIAIREPPEHPPEDGHLLAAIRHLLATAVRLARHGWLSSKQLEELVQEQVREQAAADPAQIPLPVVWGRGPKQAEKLQNGGAGHVAKVCDWGARVELWLQDRTKGQKRHAVGVPEIQQGMLERYGVWLDEVNVAPDSDTSFAKFSTKGYLEAREKRPESGVAMTSGGKFFAQPTPNNTAVTKQEHLQNLVEKLQSSLSVFEIQALHGPPAKDDGVIDNTIALRTEFTAPRGEEVRVLIALRKILAEATKELSGPRDQVSWGTAILSVEFEGAPPITRSSERERP